MTDNVTPQEQRLLQVLDPHENPSVRAKAAVALTEFDIDRFTMCRIVPSLEAVCQEEQDTVVRAAAWLALDRIAGEFQESAALRQRVIQSFGRAGSFQQQDIAFILDTLRDADAGVRMATVRVLKDAFRNTPYTVVPGMEQVIEQLAERLQDRDADIRCEAAEAFKSVAMELINDQLRLEDDPSLLTRLWHLASTIDAFHRFAVPFLAMACKDPDPRVRGAADDALLILPNDRPRRRLVADLIRLAADKDVSARYEAVIALGRVFEQCDGEERDRIVFALLASSTGDPSEDVRTEAVKSLKTARRLL